MHVQFSASLKHLKVIPPFLPPSLHDQYARGVVVCCEALVSYLACLIYLALLALLACLLAWFAVLALRT